MIITILHPDKKETELRQIQIGTNVRGLHITSLIVESAHEALRLVQAEGRNWLLEVSIALHPRHTGITKS